MSLVFYSLGVRIYSNHHRWAIYLQMYKKKFIINIYAVYGSAIIVNTLTLAARKQKIKMKTKLKQHTNAYGLDFLEKKKKLFSVMMHPSAATLWNINLCGVQQIMAKKSIFKHFVCLHFHMAASAICWYNVLIAVI